MLLGYLDQLTVVCLRVLDAYPIHTLLGSSLISSHFYYIYTCTYTYIHIIYVYTHKYICITPEGVAFLSGCLAYSSFPFTRERKPFIHMYGLTLPSPLTLFSSFSYPFPDINIDVLCIYLSRFFHIIPFTYPVLFHSPPSYLLFHFDRNSITIYVYSFSFYSGFYLYTFPSLKLEIP